MNPPAIKTLHDTPKINSVWSYYRIACLTGEAHYAEKASHSQYFKKIRKELLEDSAKNLLLYAKAIESSENKLLFKTIEKLTKEEMNQDNTSLVNNLMDQLLIRGAIDEYEKIRKSASQWKIEQNVSPNLSQLRMGFINLRNTYSKSINVTKKLRELALENIKTNAKKAPDNWKDLDIQNLKIYFSPEMVDAITAKHILSSTKLDHTSMKFWFVNTSSWIEADGSVDKELVLKTFDIILNSNFEEENFFLSLLSVIGCTEGDKETLSAISVKIEGRLKKDSNNLALQSIKLICDYVINRDSETPITSAEINIKAKQHAGFATDILLSMASTVAIAENKPQKAIEYTISTQRASSSGRNIYNLFQILPPKAFSEEKELLLENIQQEYEEQIKETWLTPKSSNYFDLFYLAKCLNPEKNIIPEPLITHVLEHVKGPDLDYIHALHAWIKKDWETLLKLVNKDDDPDSNLYLKAVALHHLSQTEEALPLLKKVLAKSPLDNDNYPLAKKLLIEIQSSLKNN